MKDYYIYILTNKPKGTLYIGVTNDIVRRILEHKKLNPNTFVGKYKLTKLVYFEVADSIHDALYREKQLKKWRRLWKIKLIESINPHWGDLSGELD